MAGSIQLSTIALALEATSGTDIVPTNTTNAIAIRVANLSVKIDQQFAERDVIVGAFAAPDKLPYARRGTLSFSCELQASGALGQAPAWGKALQACGFNETLTPSNRVDYLPASTGIKTASIYAWYNNRLEKFIYCAGSVKLSLAVGGVPSLDFTFTGLVGFSGFAAPVLPTLSAYIRPEAVGPLTTTQVSIGAVTYSAGTIAGGTQYNFKSVEVDMANDVQDLALVSAESVAIYGRSPTATLSADLGGAAHAAFKADMHAGTPRAFGLVHGSASGKKVGIYAPVGVITSVEDQVEGPVLIDKLGFTLRPSANNDEFRIFCI